MVMVKPNYVPSDIDISKHKNVSLDLTHASKWNNATAQLQLNDQYLAS